MLILMVIISLQLLATAGGVASVGERVTFSSPDENARAGETAPKFQCQPTLAAPLVVHWWLIFRAIFPLFLLFFFFFFSISPTYKKKS